MFHGLPFLALAVLALVIGLALGLGVAVLRDGRAARRMNRGRP